VSNTVRILAGLILGLALGALLAAWAPAWKNDAVAVCDAIGGVWLDALRMTIVPLVFALLVTGIAQAADTAQAGGAAGRALGTFAVLLVLAAVMAALLVPLLLQAWPAPAEAVAALRRAARSAGAVPPSPPFAEWLRSFIPSNAIKAAADGAMAPLVFFAVVFGLAATRIEPARRERLFGFFDALQAAMMVVVKGVLWTAPAGVLALALVFTAKTGVAGVGVLIHYVIVISSMCLLSGLAGVVLGIAGGRKSVPAMIAALVPVSAVAISTQSSLASLPSMLEASRRLGISDTMRDLALPMAVALFRISSPAANLAVVIYVAHVYGLPIDAGHMAAGVIVAALVSVAAVGVASAVTFFTTLVPISVAMGMPLDLLPLFLAVETLPDLSRTIGNTYADVGVTAFLDRWGRPKAPAAAPIPSQTA
jgi:proton glutamate symport protein